MRNTGLGSSIKQSTLLDLGSPFDLRQDQRASPSLNRSQIAAALGNIIDRMAHPGNKLATHAWL